MNTGDIVSEPEIIRLLQRQTHQIILLRNISVLFSETERDLNDVITTLLCMLPEGFRYPQNARTRLTLQQKVFSTPDFMETPWYITADVYSENALIGKLEVRYLEPISSDDEPFLPDEKTFLSGVAIDLGRYIERKQLGITREQQQREIEIYLSLLRHDLRNDLNLLMGNTELLQMTLENPSSQVSFILESTMAVCNRMLDLLNKFTATENVARELISIINMVVDKTRQAQPQMQIRVNIDDNIDRIEIQPSRLIPMVFENLLRNVVIHAGTNANVEIDIHLTQDHAEILVSDDGPGVAEEIRPRLFCRGVSTRNGGQGLYLCREVLRSVGGDITLAESKIGGASFRVTIPLRLG